MEVETGFIEDFFYLSFEHWLSRFDVEKNPDAGNTSG